MNDIQPIIDLHTAVQGEGKLAGIAHILVRLSGCNLRCSFKGSLCDTPYSSWHPEKGKYSLSDVQKMIDENPQIKCILITGGEPSIHIELLYHLIKMGNDSRKHVTIETNGTIDCRKSLGLGTECRVDLISISPKLSNSSNFSEYTDPCVKEKHDSTRENIDAIISWILHSEWYQLKYVVSEEKDLDEIQEQLSKIKKRIGNVLDNGNVYLMPEGETNKELSAKRQWLIEKCIEHGYSYTDRLHVIAYGKKRGV